MCQNRPAALWLAAPFGSNRSGQAQANDARDAAHEAVLKGMECDAGRTVQSVQPFRPA